MSIDAHAELSAPQQFEVDPGLVREIESIEADTANEVVAPETNFFRDLDSLTHAMIPQAIINKAIEAYFHDVNALPTAEQPGWWKHYFETVLPQETASGERIRWAGQLALWMINNDDRFRDGIPDTELSNAIYVRRDIVETLDAEQRAKRNLSPREPAWDSPTAEPWLARNGPQ